MTKRPPLLGYNHNVRHAGRLFHVQTEDSGLSRLHLTTHVFFEGTILATARSTYTSDELDATVQKRMQGQHKTMLKRLRDGEFDNLPDVVARGHAPRPSQISPRPDASAAPRASMPESSVLTMPMKPPRPVEAVVAEPPTAPVPRVDLTAPPMHERPATPPALHAPAPVAPVEREQTTVEILPSAANAVPTTAPQEISSPYVLGDLPTGELLLPADELLLSTGDELEVETSPPQTSSSGIPSRAQEPSRAAAAPRGPEQAPAPVASKASRPPVLPTGTHGPSTRSLPPPLPTSTSSSWLNRLTPSPIALSAPSASPPETATGSPPAPLSTSSPPAPPSTGSAPKASAELDAEEEQEPVLEFEAALPEYEEEEDLSPSIEVASQVDEDGFGLSEDTPLPVARPLAELRDSLMPADLMAALEGSALPVEPPPAPPADSPPAQGASPSNRPNRGTRPLQSRSINTGLLRARPTAEGVVIQRMLVSASGKTNSPGQGSLALRNTAPLIRPANPVALSMLPQGAPRIGDDPRSLDALVLDYLARDLKK